MKQTIPPAALAAIAVLVVAVIGFFAYRTFGPQGLSPEERRQEQVMIQMSEASTQRHLSQANGGGQMSSAEEAARKASGAH